MKYLLIILILLLSSTCFANEIRTVRQLPDFDGQLNSQSYIHSLENYEAGRFGAAESMHEVFNAHYYDKYNSGLEDIFYSDEFKYGGRYDLMTYYWNPPVEYFHPVDTAIPEPLTITILLCGIPMLIRRQPHQNEEQ